MENPGPGPVRPGPTRPPSSGATSLQPAPDSPLTTLPPLTPLPTTTPSLSTTPSPTGAKPVSSATPPTDPPVTVLRTATQTTLDTKLSDARLSDARFAEATYGISVWLDGYGEVVSHNAETLLLPASNQKLWTAVGAHLVLPADFTFVTELRAVGPVDAGVLNGDLYVVGGGDPTLRTAGPSHSLDSLAAIVKAAGINSITGRVIIDESRYDTVRTPKGWEPWQLEFVGPLSAFMVDWNNLRKEVEFMNDPTRANARTFVDRLAQANIVVLGGVDVARTPAASRLLHVERSWDLPRLLAFMLQESDNMMAESFVREIGRRRSGVGSTPAGLAAIDEVITQQLCLPREGVNDDGSGVSHYSRHSARYWRRLLDVARAQPWGASFDAELAVSGQSGTMKTRLTSAVAAGRVRAKTGTVRGGRALSGYATTVGGRTVVFSVIANGDDSKLSSKLIDDLIETIVAIPD